MTSNTSLRLLTGSVSGGPGLTYNIYYNAFVVDPSYGVGASEFVINSGLYFSNGLFIETDQTSTTNSLVISTNPLAAGNWSIIVPSVTNNDTFVTNDFPATLTNKNLSDSTTYVVDVADATKRIGFDVTGSSSTTLTVTSAQTTTQTLNLPNITQTDTAIVSFLPQTAYKKVLITGQDAAKSTLNTFNGSYPFVSVPSNTSCQNIAFTPDGLTAYVANTGSNNIRVYSLRTTATGSITTALIATWTPAGLSPTGICYSGGGGGIVAVTSSTNGNYAAYAYNAGNGASPISAVLALGSGSQYPVVSVNQSFAYVANKTANTVSIVAINGSSKNDVLTV